MASAPTTPPALVPSSSGAFFAAPMDMEASLSATMLPPPTMRAPSTSPSAMPAARSTSTTFDPGAMAEVADVDHGEHISILLSPNTPSAGMTPLSYFTPLADAGAMLGIDHAVPLDPGPGPGLPFQEADSLTVAMDDAVLSLFDVSGSDLMALLAGAVADVAAAAAAPAAAAAAAPAAADVAAPAVAAPAAAPEPAPASVPVLVPAAAVTKAAAAAAAESSSSSSSSSGSASPPPARRSSRQSTARRSTATANTTAAAAAPARVRRPAAVSSAEEMYRIHRDRNNEAARVSRQRRRNREDNLQRANQELADENVQLRARVGEQDRLIAHLQQMLAERMR